MKYHLAQVNIALARDDMASETMHGFVSRLAEINALAEKSEGFIWRLQEESGDATAIRIFDDPGRSHLNSSERRTSSTGKTRGANCSPED